VKVVFFETPAEFRAWLQEHHEAATELWVGYYKKATGRPSMNWSESVDQALCFGWVDGIRKSVDEDSYANRFTPRKTKSNWSNVNIEKVARLKEQGLMTPAGLRAFEAREAAKSGVYSFEQNQHTFDPAYEAQFQSNAGAWEFFQSQPPGYRRIATHWVMSAKREETRQKRLATLVDDSKHGRRIGLLTRTTKGS
jgi:uncharacterized protein YdeI (YjbR/CyaY-like superfamily)